MGLLVLMKKFFVGLPIVFIWSIICLIAIIGFFWEVIDVGKFVPFAFITSIMLPLVLEIVLIILAVLIALFLLTFIIYWFNIDMKLVRKIYDALQKHYDNMKRDKKL